MRELLERWAELEPQRCQLADNRNCVVLINHVWRRVRYDMAMPDDRPRVLWAVIEAIKPRDLYFELAYYPPLKTHQAKVGNFNSAATDDPAEAALSAYIQALEAVKPS